VLIIRAATRLIGLYSLVVVFTRATLCYSAVYAMAVCPWLRASVCVSGCRKSEVLSKRLNITQTTSHDSSETNFLLPIICFISKTVSYNIDVSNKGEQEIICALLNGDIANDLE